MMSTYLGYNQITRDMARSLERVAADPIVARDAAYYRENIGKVSTVDEFIDDYRLFSYAMKAYGLEDMTYAKAFMRQALESDLSDPKSFANKLADDRYRRFAAAFPFGKEANAEPFDAQSDLQEEETIGLYSQRIAEQDAAYTREFNYYKARIGEIETVDQFIADERLTEFALSAVGIDTRYFSSSFLRGVLTADADDPGSFVNQEGNERYARLTDLFNFQADGTLADGVPAQDADAVTEITEDYIFTVPGRATTLGAELNSEHFRQVVATVTSVDELMADSRAVNFLATSYGIDITATRNADMKAALTSDLSDPQSFANTHEDAGFLMLAKAFHFLPDGTLPAGANAQTAEETDGTIARYKVMHDNDDEARDARQMDFYKAASSMVTTVDGLLGNSQVYDYVLKAHGFDPDAESRNTIRRVLLSDLNDPMSFANRQSDTRYRALAAAFSFDAEGNATAPRVAQDQAAVDAFSSDYIDRIDTLGISQKEAEAEARYYREEIIRIGSLDEFLADDRLVRFSLQASGIDPASVDDAFLRNVLTSDSTDPESFVNGLDNGDFRLLAARFNFDAEGRIEANALRDGQSIADTIVTQENYLRQTLEEQEGMENEGVRLALYFERMAGEINSAFDILADPALQEVARIALGLPPEIAMADIDAQATLINERLDIADFSDPEKLKEFISRFSALYDLENGAADPTSMLFSGGGSALGADMLMSLAQLNGRNY